MPPPTTRARCRCGAVTLEVRIPPVWAWHDHTLASRQSHGAAYATYIGTWRSRLTITQGEDNLTEYNDPETNTTRHFCRTCGTPVLYIRAHSPKMVNIPRALFAGRTGREPRYHVGFDEAPDWAYAQEPLAPLKGYPGVLHRRPKRPKKTA